MNRHTAILILSISSIICIIVFFVFLLKYQSVPSLQTQKESEILPITDISKNETVQVESEEYHASTSSKRNLRPLPDELFNVLKDEWVMLDSYSGLVANVKNEYNINYTKRYDEFRIEIKKEPAENYRREVEESLRTLLKVSNEELCTLQIFVMRRTELTGDIYFQDIGLSFCPGSVSDTELLKPYYEE